MSENFDLIDNEDAPTSYSSSTPAPATNRPAIKGMLPKNRLGREMASKLKVYAGPEQPHAAQAPLPYKFEQVSQIIK